MLSCFYLVPYFSLLLFFFFNDTATTEIYTLSLHDALPISPSSPCTCFSSFVAESWATLSQGKEERRKSTRLNSSHSQISYAVFCLKKKKKTSIHVPINLYIEYEVLFSSRVRVSCIVLCAQR